MRQQSLVYFLSFIWSFLFFILFKNLVTTKENEIENVSDQLHNIRSFPRSRFISLTQFVQIFLCHLYLDQAALTPHSLFFGLQV